MFVGCSKEKKIKSLCKQLETEDEEVRDQAVRGLVKIGKPAIPILMLYLTFDTTTELEKFLFAHPRDLEPFLSDDREEIGKELVDRARWIPRNQYLATGDVLAKIGEPAIPPLIEALGMWSVANDASYALVKIGEPTVPALIKVLSHQSWFARSNAAYTLGEIGGSAQSAVLALREVLDGKNLLVCRRAVEALGKIGTPEALKALEEYEKER